MSVDPAKRVDKSHIFKNMPNLEPITLSEDRDPWTRQRGEGAKPYACFVIYRDLGQFARSIAKVGEQVMRSPSLLWRWSRRWRWVDRVAAFDQHEDNEQRKALSKERVDALKRQRQVGALLVTKGLQRLLGVQSDNPREVIEAINVGALDADEAVKFLSEGTRIERLGYDLPTERQHVTGSIEQRREPDDELTRAILADPEATRLAAELAERLAFKNRPGQDNPGGLGDARKPGSVEP